jgi:hypothetical protein
MAAPGPRRPGDATAQARLLITGAPVTLILVTGAGGPAAIAAVLPSFSRCAQGSCRYSWRPPGNVS